MNRLDVLLGFIASWPEIRSLVSRQARDVIKALRKRLGSKNPNTLLFAVMVSVYVVLDEHQSSSETALHICIIKTLVFYK